MRRLAPLVLVVLAFGTERLVAQSSQFGIRGLGIPGRAGSVRTLGTAGTVGLFDGESSENPAALGTLGAPTGVFTSTSSSRRSTNAGGTATARDSRFPQTLIGGPIPKTRFAAAVSYAMFADRDFSLVAAGVASPRGVPVEYTDTLTSRGGINDLRLATAYAFSPRFVIGGGLHLLTGSNRMTSRRAWEDSSYLAEQEKAELSYHAVGFSAGVMARPWPAVELAGTFRKDGDLEVQRDSTPTVSVALPTTLAAAIRLTPTPKLALLGKAVLRDWSVSDAGIRAAGAVGARDTKEFAGGLEYYTNPRRPNHKVLRLGIRTGELPFLITPDAQPKEWAVSVGTGVRFARDLGGVDLSLERVRRTQGSVYTETGWSFSFGITVRPGT